MLTKGAPHTVYSYISNSFRRVKIKNKKKQKHNNQKKNFFAGVLTATLHILFPKVIHKHHQQSNNNYIDFFCNVLMYYVHIMN